MMIGSIDIERREGGKNSILLFVVLDGIGRYFIENL